MVNNKELSPVTGERLKQLRKDKKISAAKMSEIIESNYDTHLDRTSISNYENSQEYHSHSHACNGMSVATLRILADFFGVSTDYLLGLTDIRTPSTNAQKIIEYTGLEETSVMLLHANRNTQQSTKSLPLMQRYCKEKTHFLNSLIARILSNDSFEIVRYITAVKNSAHESQALYEQDVDKNDPYSLIGSAEEKKMTAIGYKAAIMDWFGSFLDEYFSGEMNSLNEAENKHLKSADAAFEEIIGGNANAE